MRILAPMLLAVPLAVGSTACGGKDKKKDTTPAGSTGSVSDGGSTSLPPGFDPANADPEGEIPTADPNDRPPELADGGDEPEAGDEPAKPGEPEPIKPPGLDMSAQERKEKVALHLNTGTAALRNNGDADTAIAEARAALKADETSIEAMVLLAHANLTKGYLDLTEDILMKAFERGGRSNKQAFFLLGLVYQKTERHEKAPIAYQNALTLDPNYTSALMNLGVYHLRSKRYKDAVVIFEKLSSSLGIDTAPVWVNLGSAYRGHSLEFATTDITRRNQLILKAEEAYRRAISKDKNYANAYYNMGLLFLDADPFPTPSGDMDRVARLKKAKTNFDEYRRLPGADLKLVDATAAVAQKLLDKEERLRKKKAEREAKLKALEEKRKAREAAGKDDFDSDEGFE